MSDLEKDNESPQIYVQISECRERKSVGVMKIVLISEKL